MPSRPSSPSVRSCDSVPEHSWALPTIHMSVASCCLLLPPLEVTSVHMVLAFKWRPGWGMAHGQGQLGPAY